MDEATNEIREIPCMFLADGQGGWLVNIGMVAWHRGPIELAAVRRQLRKEGRKLKRISGRYFVLLVPTEVEPFYRISLYWSRLFKSEFGR